VFLFVRTDLHEPIDKTKQMPKGIQMVAVPRTPYPYSHNWQTPQHHTGKKYGFWSFKCRVITLHLIDDHKYWFGAQRTGCDYRTLIYCCCFLSLSSSHFSAIVVQMLNNYRPFGFTPMQHSNLHETILYFLPLFYLALINRDQRIHK